jgi:hypothetical protein
LDQFDADAQGCPDSDGDPDTSPPAEPIQRAGSDSLMGTKTSTLPVRRIEAPPGWPPGSRQQASQRQQPVVERHQVKRIQAYRRRP